MNSSAQPKPNTVWITGVGAVSCLGSSMDSVWSAVLENRSGILDGLGPVPPETLQEAPRDMRAKKALAFCVVAAREAMKQAGWEKLNAGDGLILATTTGQILEWDYAYIDFINQRMSRESFREKFNNQPLGELLKEVGQVMGHQGPSALLTSACSASTQALGLGAMWIRSGKVKRCLVAGAEVLCDLTVEGFRRLQLLSKDIATPFDVSRGGINLSEGAAVICLEAKSDRPLAELSGYGFSSDGYHMTGPHPEGDGSFRAMENALKKAGVAPEEITWAHAHGTGSPQNDISEGLAMSRLFGENSPWVSSTKWLHGHALAASGVLELALDVRAMQEGLILCTRGLKIPDPKIPVRHLTKDLKTSVKHVLKNTLGFGGSNAAIVISHPARTRA